MFKGKHVLITGVSSGIGAAQTSQFLEHGAMVSGLDIIKSSLTHANFHFSECDVTNQAKVRHVVNEALMRQPIDILVHTAGRLDGYASTLETDEALFDMIMTTNFKSLYYLTNAILPKMVERKQGVIVTMTSIAGLVAGGGGAAYTASKHAVAGYTKQLAYDYSKYGIRVNGIAPGAIETPMNKADFEGTGEMARTVAAETPIGRWGSAEEVANLTLFLASESSSYMQGTIIPIDGGWTMK